MRTAENRPIYKILSSASTQHRDKLERFLRKPGDYQCPLWQSEFSLRRACHTRPSTETSLCDRARLSLSELCLSSFDTDWPRLGDSYLLLSTYLFPSCSSFSSLRPWPSFFLSTFWHGSRWKLLSSASMSPWNLANESKQIPEVRLRLRFLTCFSPGDLDPVPWGQVCYCHS